MTQRIASRALQCDVIDRSSLQHFFSALLRDDLDCRSSPDCVLFARHAASWPRAQLICAPESS